MEHINIKIKHRGTCTTLEEAIQKLNEILLQLFLNKTLICNILSLN